MADETNLPPNTSVPGYGLKFLNSLITQPLSWMAPDPRLTAITGGPEALNYVPFTGAVEGLSGMISGVSDAAGTLRNYVTGRDDNWNIPGMETMRTLGQHGEATRREMQGQVSDYTPLTAPDPNNMADRLVDVAGSTLGFGIPTVGAGVVKGAAELLPSFAKWIPRVALPSTENVGAALKTTGVLAGANTALAGTQEAAAGEPQQSPPMPSFGEYVAQKDQPMPSFGEFMANPPQEGVTFQQQGVGEHTVGGALATLAGLVAALAAGKMTHGIGGAVTDAGRTARFEDPTYVAKAQDYNNAKIARGGAEISSDTVTPPLAEANRLHTATNALNTQLLDQHAQMQDAIRMMADPTVAESLAHEYGDTHNDMAVKTKLAAFMSTGYDPKTGVQIPIPDRVLKRFSRLDPVEDKIMTDGLSAADEMDNRRRNLRDFQNAKGTDVVPEIDDVRHNFKNQSDEDLQAHIDRMAADPKLNALADDYWRLGSGTVNIGKARGFFPESEANDLLGSHPHYTPEVGVTGETLHPLGSRDRTSATGVDQVNSKPWINMTQHLEELYPMFDKNDLNRKLVQSFEDAQTKNPGAAQFVYDATPPKDVKASYSGGPFREPVVTVRTAEGPKYKRIDHPDLYNAMTNNSLKQAHIMAEAMTIPRRLFQKGTTGSLSLATGYAAPIVNAGYTSVTMPLNARKGMYGGIVQKGVQRLTGHDSSVARGIDMVTNLPGMAYSYGRGVFDRRAFQAADWLDRSATNPVNRFLRSTVGDVQVDKMQAAMDRYYLSTKTAQMRQRGVGGQGIPIRTDLPSLQMNAEKTASLASARAVPDVFFADKWRIPGTNIAVKPFAVKLNRVVEEAMSNISESGHDYFMRLNWDNPNFSRESVAYEARRLTGDPGVRGSNKALGVATAILPYSNISIQGTSRLVRSFGARPLGSTITLATGLGTLALAEILTHMRSQEHMDYLQNQVSLQQRESGVILATSDDPTRGTIIRLPQELRAQYALMLNLVANAVNVTAMQHEPDVYNGVLHAIQDYLGSHITESTVGAIQHGVVDVTNAANLPPMLGQIDQNKLFQGQGLVDSYRSPVAGAPSSLPNQVPDGPLDDKNGKVFSKIFANVFGMAGTLFDLGNNAIRYAHQTGSWVDGLGMAGHDWLQGLQDKNPQTNILFEHQLRLSTQTPIIERTERELDWMNKNKSSRTEPNATGFTSRGRTSLPVPMSETQKAPTDPVMARMQFTLSNYYSRMAPQLAEINDIRKQMGAVQQQGMSVTERRSWMNDRTRDLSDKYRFLHDMVNDVSAQLSRIAGRPIHVGQSIDWQKGVDQFD